jgi:hypothetical protein
LTTDVDALPGVCGVAGALETGEVVDVLLELPPHAASSNDAATVGNMTFTS